MKLSPLNYESSDYVRDESRTPTDEFYVRTNFDMPALDARTHRITLSPLGKAAVSVSLDELRALGTVSFDATLECAGNDRISMVPLPPGETWRGGAVSSALWTGVPLNRILAHYGMADGAAELLFRGADAGTRDGKPTQFERSLPVDVALSDGPLLVLEMNGEPLRREHGAPIRLLVPGWYAMASVKWLTHIEARTEAFTGHFQTDRYIYRRPGQSDIPVREMLVKSMITSPGAGQMIDAAPTMIRGWAWSGAAEVTSVEVSLNAEAGWQRATLLPSNGPHAWRAFEIEWPKPVTGHHVLRSRATDASGATQPDVAAWNALGYGNNAIRLVSVTVR